MRGLSGESEAWLPWGVSPPGGHGDGRAHMGRRAIRDALGASCTRRADQVQMAGRAPGVRSRAVPPELATQHERGADKQTPRACANWTLGRTGDSPWPDDGPEAWLSHATELGRSATVDRPGSRATAMTRPCWSSHPPPYRPPRGVARQKRTSFRALVETSSDWIWETDAEGKYVYASPRVRELLGYEPSEILGRTPFSLMPPEEAERVRAEFERAAVERKPIVRSAQPERSPRRTHRRSRDQRRTDIRLGG